MNIKKVIPLIKATPDNLQPYGKFIGKPQRPPTLARGDIDYYHDLHDANDFTNQPVASYLVCHNKGFILTQIERHRHTEEAFIPLSGESIMVMGKVGQLNVDELVAVHFDGSFGIIFYKDTWHFAPFAITETATFMLLSGKDSGPDIEVIDVEPMRITTPQQTKL